MTDTTPDTGNAPGLSDAKAPDAVRARIKAFCDHFAVEPPGKLKTRKGKVYLTDDLLQWCEVNGASIDWILIENPMAALAAYREKHLCETRAINAVRKLADDEAKIIFASLRDAQAKIAARRAEKEGEAMAYANEWTEQA